MSFWDIFAKKKQNSSKNEVHPFMSSMEMIKNQELYNSLATYTTACLSSLKLTGETSMKSFSDDKGLLDSLVFSATVASAYTKLKDQSSNEFFGVCGSNALGRGLYVSGMQDKLNKPVSQFTTLEVEEIIGAFRYTSDYELGLRMINVEAGTTKHQAFSNLVIKVANYYLEICSDPLDKENLRSYMQALFNAGVTVVYQ